MYKYLLPLLFLVLSHEDTNAQFEVSQNKHFIIKDKKPFFWMGDTAWELFHRLNKQEVDYYLEKRSKQGFTIIQAVILAELDGLHTPNPYGERPLLNDDPTKPNEQYFSHVDYVIDKAEKLHLNIALVPTWGDKLFKSTWGQGPEIFTIENASIYASWLAKRYKNRTNIIWILGGDRNPRNEHDVAIWRAMGQAIQKETNNKALITYHSQPNSLGSAEWFANEDWLSFTIFQNGHCRDEPFYNKMIAAFSALPQRPILDSEPIYEDHPVCFNEKDFGTSNAYDVRKYAYLNLFAGAFGHTYGCHGVWQMYSPKKPAINGPHFFWDEALELPGAKQMAYVRKLMESHPMLDRVPDQSILKERNTAPSERIQATRGKDYIYVYSAAGKPFTINPNKISGTTLNAYWYNPRDGKIKLDRKINNIETHFIPPSQGYGQDWVLILDHRAKNDQTL